MLTCYNTGGYSKQQRVQFQRAFVVFRRPSCCLSSKSDNSSDTYWGGCTLFVSVTVNCLLVVLCKYVASVTCSVVCEDLAWILFRVNFSCSVQRAGIMLLFRSVLGRYTSECTAIKIPVWFLPQCTLTRTISMCLLNLNCDFRVLGAVILF